MKNQTHLNSALRILLSTNALVIVAGAMLGPIYALFVEDIGGDLLDVSIIATGFSLVAGITTIIVGKLSDKLKESELIIVFGYALMGVGFLLYLFVNSVIDLLFVGMLIGFAEAIYAPAFDATYTRHMTKHQAGNVWGAWEAMSYFTSALGALIGGVLVTYYGFGPLFIAMGLLCIGSALYIYLLPRTAL